jgi:hypothetical protein
MLQIIDQNPLKQQSFWGVSCKYHSQILYKLPDYSSRVEVP